MTGRIALGGFTGPEADTLGYAVRKKKRDVLQAQKSKFVEGCVEGLDRRILQRLRRGDFAVGAHLDLHGLTRGPAKPEIRA